jgi:hypothetical protein
MFAAVTKLRDTLSTLRGHLYLLGEREPLSKLSLVVIIALDLFILTVLFEGLADHTRQLTSPDEYLPYSCKRAFIDQEWLETNRLGELQPLVLSAQEGLSYGYEGELQRARPHLMHPTCSDFYRQLRAIEQEALLQQLFVQRKQLETQRGKLNQAHSRSREAYDTSLLESIAGQRGEGLDSLATASRRLSLELDAVTQQLGLLDQQLDSHPLLVALWHTLASDEERRRALMTDHRAFQYWYALKKLAWQMLFILPLFFLFYLWSARSVKRERRIQTLIASHLLVVSAIPILLKTIELVLDLIPHHFLQNLFKILESLHLLALWHYLVIMASIAAALLLISLIQKKLFNLQRTHQRRLIKGACHQCALKLPPAADHCPFCGAPQQKLCHACHQPTPLSAAFCTRCGARG